MLRIREAIVVEGRYDKNTLSQLVDTVIIETSGFGIFKDKERLALLQEGKLGVEGMRPEVLEAALRRAGATFLDEEGERAAPAGRPITKADFVALGLSGGPGAAEKRRALLQRLELPEHLSPNAMLEVLNALFTREELNGLLRGPLGGSL